MSLGSPVRIFRMRSVLSILYALRLLAALLYPYIAITEICGVFRKTGKPAMMLMEAEGRPCVLRKAIIHPRLFHTRTYQITVRAIPFCILALCRHINIPPDQQ